MDRTCDSKAAPSQAEVAPLRGSQKTVSTVFHTDARIYQIGALLLLLIYGLFGLKFDVSLPRVLIILATALLTQHLCTRIWNLPSFEPKSALISGLSLCLLCRTNSLMLAIATAMITISSKFLLRWRGKHLFNPTNFGLVFMLIFAQGAVWVSPGQWGSFAFFAFLVICLGGLVITRAARADVTLAFLASWLSILFGRSLWLGEPLAIPIHRLQNGALLIFAFFMISDPKTTPNSRTGRIVFAFLVAFGAGVIQFKLFRTNGLLWSLAGFSLLVPVLDRLLPGRRYQWGRPAHSTVTQKKTSDVKGTVYEPLPA